MKCTVNRDSSLNVTGVCIEIPIMTEHGWATVVTEDTLNEYSTRGVRNSGVMQRTDTIENCPNQLNEKGDEYPNYLSHRMWDGGFIKELD